MIVKCSVLSLGLATVALLWPQVASAAPTRRPEYTIVIHGGADDYTRATMSEVDQAAYLAKLKEAVEAGRAVLESDVAALDAVEASLRVFEDSVLFDTGRGSVLNADGEVELDAAIMNGSDLRAGSVAGMMTTKHPISAARAVMEKTKHVMLAGRGADRFAASVGLEAAPNSYFISPGRLESWKRVQAGGQAALPPKIHYGTVGAVVLDRQGHLAAGTSTGGRTNKMPGRIGDSPIIGAGTYASADCAVSATGAGEYFIRATAARDICARHEMLKEPLSTAVRFILIDKIGGMGGEGGAIALDKDGNVVMMTTTPTLFRAVARSGQPAEVRIFVDENQ